MEEIKYRKWLNEQKALRTIINLKKKGFQADFTNTAEESLILAVQIAKNFDSIGFGGSSTTRRLGLPGMLERQGKIIFDHWNPPPDTTDYDIRLKQGRCDCFICSANAITETGEIINVDGVGNRTNAMTFGCPNVLIIAGINKITRDLESGLKRIKEVAAPMRAKSLNMDTPCAHTGLCTDCHSPQRICRITTILHQQPMMTSIRVIIFNEEAGF